MSAALSAGASLTPSPVMATTLLEALSIRTRRTLSSGATRAMTPICGSCLSSSSSLTAHRSEHGAGNGPTLDAELSGDRSRGRRMVTSDHPHPDAGTPALGDGGLRLGPGRIDDPDHREQGEILHEIDQVATGVERRGIEVALGHQHYALTGLDQAGVRLQGQRAVLVGDRDHGSIGGSVEATA